MDRIMLKDSIELVKDLVEKFGEDYIEELYFSKDDNFEETGTYNIYAATDDGVINIVTGLYYDEVDWVLKVLEKELEDTIERLWS